jgi:polyisoprenoid-binding protein YceI
MKELHMAADTWNLDPTHSGISFTVRHLVISKVRGSFGGFTAEVKLDPANLAASSAKVSIDVATISTGTADRDNHLKSPDFFDVAKFPTMTFVSGKVEVKNQEHFTLHGALTLHGVTKDVALDGTFGGVAKDPWGNEKAGFELKGSVNRKDFGLNWNQALETGGVLVSENVELNIELEVAKAK